MTRMRESRGFTIIEMLIALSIVSILVRIAIPAYDGFRREAVASQAVADFNAVRAAAVAQFSSTGSYAADATAGVTPTGMGPYLPPDFSFVRNDYELDWENFAVADSASPGTPTGEMLALTVTTHDPRTGLQVLRALGGTCSHWSVGDSHTFVMFTTNEIAP